MLWGRIVAQLLLSFSLLFQCRSWHPSHWYQYTWHSALSKNLDSSIMAAARCRNTTPGLWLPSKTHSLAANLLPRPVTLTPPSRFPVNTAR